MKCNKTVLALLCLTSLYLAAEELAYHPDIKVPANRITIQYVQATQPKHYAEIGVLKGATALAISKVLDSDATMYLFDFNEVVSEVSASLAKQGFLRTKTFGNSHKLRDSYNWNLMKLYEQNPDPIFDYVFIDGVHMWEPDALTFFMVDLLLKPGGYLDFDDYSWSMNRAPLCREQDFPLNGKLYTQEQMYIPNVKKIVDLLVKRSGRYKEIVPNKIYQKMH